VATKAEICNVNRNKQQLIHTIMMTSDDTQLLGKNTQVENPQNEQTAPVAEETSEKQSATWKKVAIGGTSGILLGAGALYAVNAMAGETQAAAADPESGTVRELNRGKHFIGKKVVEEAGEVWMAAEYEGREKTAEEISQLLYHLQVMMIANDLELEDVYRYL